MKRKLEDYQDFCTTIKNNELVYLFGAGISSSLTDNHACSWWRWIVNGIAKMKDRNLAEQYKKMIDTDQTADNLIAVVGKVLAATKADGVYEEWMQESFEQYTITNYVLANTLQKLLITQDVFATTNYDSLLEQATGLDMISYEEPEKAFFMLDKKKSEAVLHIHGVYNSAKGIDNIVADQEQYDNVINNKGAQFIQHILGTRTLIFVGCGKTTDDANISRFIQFAKEYLHMERDYYFLCKTGDETVDLPDNIKPVVYGDEYSDLPIFLEDMAQMRLKTKIESNPIVGRTVVTHKADVYGLSEYHYSNEYLKFCGRKRELAQLDEFAEMDRRIQWWAVTGQGGSGKSRLAFEFLKRCQREWFGFFLNFSVSEETVNQFVPFNDTMVIIDYVKGNEKQIAKIVSLLIDKFKLLTYKLRILFLERDNFILRGSWYDLLLTAFDMMHRAEFNEAEYNLDMLTRKHRFLLLDDLEDEAVIELIGNICEKKELPIDTVRDRNLKEDYAKKFEQLKFRPLFLQLYVEAWIDNGCTAVEYENYRSLLNIVVIREQERILQMLEGDMVVFNALIKFIIRASISDGFSFDDIKSLYETEWNIVRNYAKTHSLSGKQRIEYLCSILRDTSQSLDTTDCILKPLYPDIIKEYMFLYYLEDEDRKEMSVEAWNNCPVEYNMFLSRCIMDFQNDEDLIDFIRKESEDCTNLNAMQVRQSLLAYKVIHTIDEGEFFFKLAVNESDYWDKIVVDDKNREIVLQGLYECVWQFLGWSDKQKCFQFVDRIFNFEGEDSIQVSKARHLIEFAHYLIEKNCVDTAQRIIKQANYVIDQIESEQDRKNLLLYLYREKLVTLVYYQKWNEIDTFHEKIYDSIDWKNENQVEEYAYICSSGAELCHKMLLWEKLLMFADWMQELAEDYGAGERKIYFNDKVHYYYLYTKFLKVEAVSIATQLEGWGFFGLESIQQLIGEVEANEMIADFSGILIGAKALKVGADDEITDIEVREYLTLAENLLERYPDNALLAEKVIFLWHTVYEFQYKKKVPKLIVDRAYALAVRFVTEEDVLHEFFEILTDSTEKGNWLYYTRNKGIRDHLIEFHMTDYLYPPIIKETYRRKTPKISANEPCPCGSGKKFKKCCRGKGIYD